MVSPQGARLEGFKFKRQEWVGGYIADFYCWEARLIVEADGSQHQDELQYDRARDQFLRAHGFAVLRFWNNEIERDLDGVLTEIRSALLGRVPSPSHPLRGWAPPSP